MGLLIQIYQHRWQLVLAALAFIVGVKIRTYNRLRAFKGPFSSGFSNFWHSKALLGPTSHLKYREVCDKYGSIARIGPNDLITCSPELLTHMSAVRSPYTRGAWYHRAARHRPGKDNLFSEVSEEVHTRRRSQMAAGYSGKENKALEASIDGRVAELIHLIRTKYLSTDSLCKPMDFGRKIQYLTLDVISEIGFGESFGNLRADTDVNSYIKSGEIGLGIAKVTLALGLTNFMQLPIVSKSLGPSEKDEDGFGRLMANARAVINSRLEKGAEDRSDMLASFVRHGLDADQLLTESTLQIIAGADTTAAALRTTFLYLFSHPRVYMKLQSEVDAAIRGGLALPAPEILPDSAARKLPYLQAVIKEAIRVHPPVTDPVPKRVPDGGETVMVDGKPVFLPGGTNVSYAVWPLHLSKDIFGADAEEFRPERWLLEVDAKKLATMNHVHELVFGHGKYQCLGKPIALMEIGKTIFELMRNFDWCLAKPDHPWKEVNHMGLFTQHDMWVLATERQATL